MKFLPKAIFLVTLDIFKLFNIKDNLREGISNSYQSLTPYRAQILFSRLLKVNIQIIEVLKLPSLFMEVLA